MLTIIPAADAAPTTLSVVLYGGAGVGKTSLAMTAAPQSLVLDFDRGAHRASAAAKASSVHVPCPTWEAVADLTVEDLEPFGAVVIDTVGAALDALTLDIIRREPRMGNRGVLTLPGYGRLKQEFAGFLRLVRSADAHTVIVAHAIEQKNGDEIIERIDATGASRQLIHQTADLMGRVLVKDDDARVVDFRPSRTAYGKDQGLGARRFFEAETRLGRMISEAIEHMGGRPAEPEPEPEPEPASPPALTAAAANRELEQLVAKEAPMEERQELWLRAKRAGLSWAPDAKAFR